MMMNTGMATQPPRACDKYDAYSPAPPASTLQAMLIRSLRSFQPSDSSASPPINKAILPNGTMGVEKAWSARSWPPRVSINSAIAQTTTPTAKPQWICRNALLGSISKSQNIRSNKANSVGSSYGLNENCPSDNWCRKIAAAPPAIANMIGQYLRQVAAN